MAKRTASAKKQARASVRRTQRNRAVRSEVKTKIVKARRSLTEAPVAESDRHAIAMDAIRALDRAASKGVLHRNNAARRKARLTRQLVRLGGVPAAAAGAGRTKKAAPAAAAKKPVKKAETRKPASK
ncbi:MAG TPA: 30S ribosomal protein S20 [Candidatus Dormibacteraeota bacterium]|jgi:small subunit ribosomal protein S20|nr:30S ribosomal protein S20 [Candidatus Dormibacteraeota bacterium]